MRVKLTGDFFKNWGFESFWGGGFEMQGGCRNFVQGVLSTLRADFDSLFVGFIK